MTQAVHGWSFSETVHHQIYCYDIWLTNSMRHLSSIQQYNCRDVSHHLSFPQQSNCRDVSHHLLFPQQLNCRDVSHHLLFPQQANCRDVSHHLLFPQQANCRDVSHHLLFPQQANCRDFGHLILLHLHSLLGRERRGEGGFQAFAENSAQRDRKGEPTNPAWTNERVTWSTD